jgi:hypothetical protein
MNKNSFLTRSSLQDHRCQRFWQIIFPIVLVSLVIGSTGGYLAVVPETGTRNWADISIIWLIIPIMLFGTVILATLVGLVYLLTKLHKGTEKAASKVQYYFNRMKKITIRVSDTAVRPIMWFKQFECSVKKVLDLGKMLKKKLE